MSVTSHFTIADRRALVEHLGRHTIKARNQIGGSGAHLATNAIEFAAKYRKAKTSDPLLLAAPIGRLPDSSARPNCWIWRPRQLADVGGICVTAAVATQIADRLEVAMEDLGDKTLKNISRPVRLYRIGFDGPVLPEIEAKRSVSKPSIVVLPFNNMSGDPEQEFLRPKSQIPSWQGHVTLPWQPVRQ